MEKFKSILKNIFYSFLWIGVLVFIIDVITKQVVLRNMMVGDKINLIGGFLYIEYNVNPGMAFGINFLDQLHPIANQIIFISISVIGGGLLIFFFAKQYKKMNPLEKVALGLMITGCLANLVDRAFYSAAYLSRFDSSISTNGVVDFIVLNFGFVSIPNFNVADSALVIGTIMLITILIIEEVKEVKQRRKLELATEGNEKILSADEKKMNEASQEVQEEPIEEVKKEDEE